jgi:hypothetical protein
MIAQSKIAPVVVFLYERVPYQDRFSVVKDLALLLHSSANLVAAESNSACTVSGTFSA